jgi:hypothetical protein
MTEADIRKELIALITDKVGVRAEEVLPNADIEKDLGCTGDDFFELMEAYAKRFTVDMSGFLWYFHSREEGHNLGGLFFRSPDQRVQRIPVTLERLVHSALNRKWSVVYPPHQIPERRRNLRINLTLGLAVITWSVISLLRHC